MVREAALAMALGVLCTGIAHAEEPVPDLSGAWKLTGQEGTVEFTREKDNAYAVTVRLGTGEETLLDGTFDGRTLTLTRAVATLAEPFRGAIGGLEGGRAGPSDDAPPQPEKTATYRFYASERAHGVTSQTFVLNGDLDPEGAAVVEAFERRVQTGAKFLIAYTDPKDTPHAFPEGFPVEIVYRKGKTERAKVGAGGILRFEVAKGHGAFTLLFGGGEPLYICVPPKGSGLDARVGREGELEAMRERGYSYFRLPGDLSLSNANWTVYGADTYRKDRRAFGTLSANDDSFGSADRAVHLVLNPGWQFFGFTYHDRVMKRSMHVPSAVDLKGWGRDADHPLMPADAHSYWRAGMSQALPWVKDGPRALVEFKTPKDTFVRRQDNGSAQLVQGAPPSSSPERTRYHRLPEVWRTVGSSTVYGSDYAKVAYRPEHADLPHLFSLDPMSVYEMQLANDDLRPASVRITLEHPGYQLDKNHRVVIGGTFKPRLNREWHRESAKLAVECGVDPYFWIAFALEEYGGYRTSLKKMEKNKDRGLGAIPTDYEFVFRSGGAGVWIGDANHSGVTKLDHIKTKLEAMGVPSRGYFGQRTGSPEQLNRQSFLFLKEHQDEVLRSQKRRYRWVKVDGKSKLKYKTVSTPSIMVGLQRVHGGGQLPYLYREGAYGDGKLVQYSGGKLVRGRAGRSGVKASDHPIYGYTLAHFIKQLHDDPRIRALIPAGAKTPVTDAVLRDFSKGTGLFGTPKS